MKQKLLLASAALLCMQLSACAQSAPWKGALIYTHSQDINKYQFATKQDAVLTREAKDAYVAKSGELYLISEKFPKRNVLIRKLAANGVQGSNLIDMSSDNPDYKAELDNYSVIRGTGISAVLDKITTPRLSPDGKYLACTVYGHPGQAFKTNEVVVFDMATKKPIKEVPGYYYPTWLDAHTLLVNGTTLDGSSDDHAYNTTNPGIYSYDLNTGQLKRLDQGLDDPTPYHAVASHDGKRIAFVLADHVWVMNRDGSNAHQLTAIDNDNRESFPTWSPDDKYIACWVYKTFEITYYTAIAIVPADSKKPVVLSNKAAVWPRDTKNYRISGGTDQINWN